MVLATSQIAFFFFLASEWWQENGGDTQQRAQAGLEPGATASRTEPPHMGCPLYRLSKWAPQLHLHVSCIRFVKSSRTCAIWLRYRTLILKISYFLPHSISPFLFFNPYTNIKTENTPAKQNRTCTFPPAALSNTLTFKGWVHQFYIFYTSLGEYNCTCEQLYSAWWDSWGSCT